MGGNKQGTRHGGRGKQPNWGEGEAREGDLAQLPGGARVGRPPRTEVEIARTTHVEYEDTSPKTGLEPDHVPPPPQVAEVPKLSSSEAQQKIASAIASMNREDLSCMVTSLARSLRGYPASADLRKRPKTFHFKGTLPVVRAALTILETIRDSDLE